MSNVNEFEGHIACDATSQSEVVVPLVANGRLFGVLDVDSADLARFDTEATQLIEGIAAIFLRTLR